ncbi:DNA-binding response OmpR family regulator [Dyadobacter sp. BE34]|uniref:DNA-binding response OmpR family regulator n=1 Tax=Dyadobacter fermentans TaxID=94254 RepID=A0ABU1QT97_9BACT|nr:MULTISPECIES: response regulator transcription factor [Dyadobacter]MDR6804375.1 DNA-binding response OmpR family regulator [Dyadobacter fermentans]MDR7042115.1 DNA-binding response OmpR family regulator [Dyadobacter sp. BE242]MDR7196518.1 DNA-binding response OmpR family regulator [Dyadobacter sp. BE34]MDR7212937.1 DNA-binding response OmpR family regulator [Dyadobacter sp. BE31]MDR7261924.1 DNA-binding response OmpR family regulator [Dyadobacter sp. BE32]
MATVLFIEDEPALGMIVKDSLVYRGFDVLYAANGADGLEQYRQHQPDIVVADIMMPDMDGFTMAEQIRRDDPHTPIMFLTARSQTADVVRGFELGGNDYLKKPFSLDELVVRINALLRTGASRTNANGTLKIGRYIFDPAKQKLTVDDREITLSHREAELLRRLYQQRNEVLGRSEVLTELWGDDSFFNGRSLDVFITKLRRHLREDPKIQIINIRGRGYKLVL